MIKIPEIVLIEVAATLHLLADDQREVDPIDRKPPPWIKAAARSGSREERRRERERSGKLDRACSRLYRSQILQENMHWKALAEIYTMHSFAPCWNPLAKNREKRAWPKQPRKGRKRENERPISSAQQAT